MPARKPYKVDIDVIPYLSIMAIVLKLICLILIVMVMRIAVNPDALKIVRYPMLYQPPEEAQAKEAKSVTNANGSVTQIMVSAENQISRAPVFFDCHPDHIEIQPENIIIPLSELHEKGGDFELTMADLIANSAKKIAIIITRPNSGPVYRYVRRQVNANKLKVGYDVLEAEVVCDWPHEIKRLELKLDLMNARRQSRNYDVPLETMTNWINQAVFERTALTTIVERVKSGKKYNDGHEHFVAPPEPAHH